MQRIPSVALLLTCALAGPLAPVAQERLSRSETLQFAFAVCLDLKQIQGTPIPTDPDVKRAVAIRDEDYGGMLLPETKLSLQSLEQAGAAVAPLGQLWLHKLVPLIDYQLPESGRLRMVTVSTPEGTLTAPLCALGVRKAAAGGLELLLYGQGREPLLATPLKTIAVQQENPIEIYAERSSDGGRVTLHILGKYEASFQVTDPDRY